MICLFLRVLDEFQFNLMNFIFTSDTSLNEPEELNHWAVQLFSTWNQAGKSCREKFQENQI